MKTAAELAKAAAQMGNLAHLMKPEDTDPYAQRRKLIQFHLQTAAALTRTLSEATAAREVKS